MSCSRAKTAGAACDDRRKPTVRLATHFKDDLATRGALAVELQRWPRFGKGKLPVDVDAELSLVSQLAERGKHFARRVTGDGAMDPRLLTVRCWRRARHGDQKAARLHHGDGARTGVGIDSIQHHIDVLELLLESHVVIVHD